MSWHCTDACNRASWARFAVQDKAALDCLYARALEFGVASEAPGELPVIAGGGYGFAFCTPDGVALSISANVARHDEVIDDRTRPSRFSHVVFRTLTCEDSEAFFCELLGFKGSDRTDHIHFLRCARDHHSVALARLTGLGLHHMAAGKMWRGAT